MTRIPSSAPAIERRRLDGQQPIDVAGHQQRLLEARRDVRIEPAGLGVRGDRLVEEPAVAAGVDESGEQLGIVAVAVGFAEQAHERSLRLADVRLEVGVELVRDRQARVELERAAEAPPRRAPRCRASPSMYLPITRWQRPRCAHAGAKRGSSSRQLLVQIARLRRARRRCAPARWRADRARRRAASCGASGAGDGARPASGSDSASTTRRAMSSCSRNRSPSDDWTVCDVSSVPPGASTSCADGAQLVARRAAACP